MLNWFAILRRILKLYGVRSTRDLGMALGVPLKFGEEGSGEKEIPWLVLEMVVSDRGVSWDWLLTGRNTPSEPAGSDEEKGLRGEEEPLAIHPKPPVSKPTRAKMPRIETRELRRALLDGGGRSESMREYLPPPDKAVEEDIADLRSQARIQSELLSKAQPSETAGKQREDAVVQELEGIKAAMEAELRRVQDILKERQNGR